MRWLVESMKQARDPGVKCNVQLLKKGIRHIAMEAKDPNSKSQNRPNLMGKVVAYVL